MLTTENFRFARQAGAEAIVAHLVDYMPGGPRIPDARTVPHGWGVASHSDIWTVDELVQLRRAVEAEGLELAAIENFEVGHWYDVLLDGPRKEEQLEGLQALVRNVGEAGIPIIGYNFFPRGGLGSHDRVVRARRRRVGSLRPRADAAGDGNPPRHGLEHDLRPRRARG